MIKLHLGCGKVDLGPEWDHIDAQDYDHIRSHNVKKLQYKDSTVDMIYASHLIGYFDRKEVIKVFNEWHRVLKPGGVLRIATPDFWRLSQMYTANKLKIEMILGPLFGRMDIGVNIYNKTAWDYPSLTRFLLTCGFTNVRRYESEIDDSSGEHLKNTLISLNVESYCAK